MRSELIHNLLRGLFAVQAVIAWTGFNEAVARDDLLWRGVFFGVTVLNATAALWQREQ